MDLHFCYQSGSTKLDLQMKLSVMDPFLVFQQSRDPQVKALEILPQQL
jgi:hypothetical protein